MASVLKMNVQSFPRPPRLEQTSRHLQIKYLGQLIADTKEAYWALETHHPPISPHMLYRLSISTWTDDQTIVDEFGTAYYLPRSSVRIPLTTTKKQTICEFKGVATYYKVELADGTAVSDRIWSYERPTPAFKPIHGYLSFYAGPWDCFVDGEKVEAQPGDFYGGWVTSDIEGIVKGRTGNLDPIV